MPSLTKIHADLCWVIYYAQKDLLDIHLQKQIDPRQLIEHIAPYTYLFDPSIITQLMQAIDQVRSEADAHLYRSMRYLLVEYGGMFENYNRMVAFQISRSTKRIKIPELDNRKITIPEAYSLTFDQNIPRNSRIAIFNKYAEYYQKQTKIFYPVIQSYQDRAFSLGYSNIFEMLNETSFFSISKIENQILNKLEDTNASFNKKLNTNLEKFIGFGLKDAEIIDIRGLDSLNFEIPQIKGKFQNEIFDKLCKIFHLEQVSNKFKLIELKSRERAFAGKLVKPVSKNSTSFLFYSNKKKLHDWKTFFHEFGHLVHYSHISENLPLLHQMTGDLSVTEFVAFLFEGFFSSDFLLSRLDLDCEKIEMINNLLDIQKQIRERNIFIQTLNNINLFRSPNIIENILDLTSYYDNLYHKYFGIKRIGYDILSNFESKISTFFSYSQALFTMDEILPKIQSKYLVWWNRQEFVENLIRNYFHFGFSKPISELVKLFDL